MVSRGTRVLKNFGAPLSTRFTYKNEVGRKRDVGLGTCPVHTNVKKGVLPKINTEESVIPIAIQIVIRSLSDNFSFGIELSG